jgi:hypothetical protein
VESSDEQVRDVQKSIHEMDRSAGEMDEHTSELRSEIDSVRQEFHRRRNDESVPGLPPDPEVEGEQSGDESESISPAGEQPPGEDE